MMIDDRYDYSTEEYTPFLSDTTYHQQFEEKSNKSSNHSIHYYKLPWLATFIGGLIALTLLICEVHQTQYQLTHPLKSSIYTTFSKSNTIISRDLISRCMEKYQIQPLNHFQAENNETFAQRYFLCPNKNQSLAQHNVIFFYVGNEADVELYLNHTGLMWENQDEFNALLIFAEHRYFGKSLPFSINEIRHHMQYLSSEQALADYAVLLKSFNLDIPVIGFGGSYGGMLASWFRMKYPYILQGAIAASAPILAFLGDEKPVDMESFARITTFDASKDAGSSAECITNVRNTWKLMFSLAKTSNGRNQLHSAFNLCSSETLETEEQAINLINWTKAAFDMLAMGNYPYPSSYIMNGQSTLPAYPVRTACEHLSEDYTSFNEADISTPLLQAMRSSVGVFYNSTHDVSCYSLSPPSNASALDGDFWDYLFCSELYMPTTVDGTNDMFWSMPWNMTQDNITCIESWNVPLRPNWAVTQYGGSRALKTASNIVFSNGNYDPWSGTGVLSSTSDSIIYVPINGGAHHLDLFFSHELDPPSVQQARQIHKENIQKWIKEFE